jgi:hypothetical protein
MKINQDKIKSYRDELNVLNQGAFTTEQQIGETEQDYLDRLNQNAELTTQDETINEMRLLTNDIFRKSMKEIIKDPVLIDLVVNSIDPIDDVTNKL